MEILTEFDELQAALAKVNMDECVMPYVRGRLVNESAYNKTQKILNCPEMISAHKYLYELDMDQLTNEDEQKIDQLYKLGCDRGFIIDDLTDWDEDDGEEEVEDDIAVAEVPVAPRQPQNTLFKAKIPCWTVIYSATKDGDIKTGEAYSNAVSMNAAKADVNAKLSQCGYDNITILAIENCTNVPQPRAMATYEMSEADDEKDSSSDDSSSNDSSSDDSSSDDSSSNDSLSDDSSSDDSDDSSSDDSSDDDDLFDISSDDDSDDSSDDDTSSDDDSDDSSDEDSSDDDSGDSSDEDSEDSDDKDSDDEDSNDEDSGDSNDEDSNDEDSDDSDDEDSEDDDSDELDANEKAELRDLYRKTFRNTLVKCKFDTSFNDLTLEQKVKFFTELAKAWKKDNEPKDFMTDKELEQLDNVVVKGADAGNDDSDDDSDDEED